MKPLNPIMAVLVIASVGASPLQTLAADGKAPAATEVKEPAGVPVKVDDTNANSITKLTEILVLSKNPKAVADAGRRISDFLLKPDGKKSFVAADVNKKVLDVVTQDWVKRQSPGDLAMLYFVVGTGETVPDWVKNDPLLSKTVPPKRDAETRLRKALSRFTEPKPAGAQIKEKNGKEEATAFLDTASIEAKGVFKDDRTMPEIRGSVEENNTTDSNPPDATRGAGSQFGGGANQYTLKDLYVDGAVVVDVHGAKDPNSRKISMKIFSKRDPDTGVVSNEIGIFDITDSPKDVFGQRFEIGGGDQAFVLDDRTPGHKKYELKFTTDKKTGELTVTFKRPGDGGKALTSTVNGLFLARADQAATLRNVVSINGEDFYTLPQGGSKSALMMFPKAMIDGRGKGDAFDLGPTLYAEVGERGKDGRNQNVKPGPNGGPMLGKVGGKDYKLVFNQKLGIWEVAAGIGDKPVVPVEAKPEGGASPGGTPGGATPGGDPNKPEMAIVDLENLLLREDYCKKFPKDSELMAEELKGKYGMIMCNPTGKPEGFQAILLVPKKVWADQQMVFKSIAAKPPAPAARLLRGRIVDNYLVLQFEEQVQYLDLRKKTDGGFELVGMVANKDVGGPPVEAGEKRAGINNMIIFLDALRNYMGVKSDSPVFAAVPKRVEEHIGKDKPFELQARYANDILQVFAEGGGKPSFQIWPNVNMPPAPTNGKYAHLGGPGNVFVGETSSMDAPFEDEFDIPSSYKLVRVGPKKANEDIVLYEAKDPNGKEDPKKHYLSFKYLGYDTTTADPASAKVKKIFRQKYFEAFNADNPLPTGLDMKGLAGGNDVYVRWQLSYRFIAGTDEKKGVMAVFQNPQLSGEQKDAKANCVGPIAWWGVASRDAAMAICKADKF